MLAKDLNTYIMTFVDTKKVIKTEIFTTISLGSKIQKNKISFKISYFN